MARKRMTAAQLFQGCVEGKTEAWRQLATFTRMRAEKIMPSEAEDVSQEVCLKMVRGALKSVKEPKAFLKFVRVSVDNEVFTRLRKSGRYISLDMPVAGQDGDSITLLEVLGAKDATQQEEISARLALLKLKESLRELPEYCEGVMDLYVRYQLGELSSYKDMAQSLKVSVNTLGVQIKRCLDALRQMPVFSEWTGGQED